MNSSERRATARRLARWLTLTLFAAYALSGPGHSVYSDGYISFLTARSLLLDRTFAIEPLPSGTIVKGLGGRSYGMFGAGAAVAFVPALLISRLVPDGLQPGAAEGPLDSLRLDEFWASLVNPALMAGAVSVILLCGVELGFSVRAALAVALSVAFASPLWLYARIDGSEALQALGIIASFFFLLRAREHGDPLRLLASGAMLGIAILTKPTNILIAPVFCALAAAHRTGRFARLEASARFIGPIAAAAAAAGIYNAVRFGSPFRVSLPNFSNPVLDGAHTLLLSPSYGLVVFWPGLALAAAGLPVFARRFRAELATIVASFIVMVALYAWHFASFGACWAPRYLVPYVPLLALLLLPIAAGGSRLRAAFVAATVLGIGVQSVAVLTSYVYQVAPVWRGLQGSGRPPVYLDARTAPLRVGAWWIRQTVLEQIGRGDLAFAELARPPWHGAYPWVREAETLPVLARLRGFDLWAAPRSWKTPYFRYWESPDDSRSIPSDPPLAVLLCLGLIGGGWSLAAGVQSSAPAACTPPQDPPRRGQ